MTGTFYRLEDKIVIYERTPPKSSNPVSQVMFDTLKVTSTVCDSGQYLKRTKRCTLRGRGEERR